MFENKQHAKSCCASGGNRTRTAFSGQGILSPSCLPFHHQGGDVWDCKDSVFFAKGATYPPKHGVSVDKVGKKRVCPPKTPFRWMEAGIPGTSPRMTQKGSPGMTESYRTSRISSSVTRLKSPSTEFLSMAAAVAKSRPFWGSPGHFSAAWI